MRRITTDQCINLFKRNPVIASVRSSDQLGEALASDCDIVFLLCGNIYTLEQMLTLTKEAGKKTFVHLDLVKGYAQDSYFVKYLAEELKPTGIISTKNNLLKRAQHDGLITVQRAFMLDSSALEASISTIQNVKPDAVEILPGCCSKLIKRVKEQVDTPIITGGFIETLDELEKCLIAGALSCSTSKSELWKYNTELANRTR